MNTLKLLKNNRRVWTRGQKNKLRALWGTGMPRDEIAFTLRRPFWGVLRMASRLGLLKRRRSRVPRIHYTAAQVAQLRTLWGVHTMKAIARIMHRPVKGIRAKASQLGLRCRIEGFESIRSAAARHGVSYHVMTLAIRYAGVQLHRKPGTGIERTVRGRRKKDGTLRAPGRHRMVACLDADEAIERFRGTESLHEAEARSGMHEKGLVRALAKIGVVRTLGFKCKWRIAKADVDRAVKVYVGGDTLLEAAARLGLSRDTMRAWLRAVGLHRTRLATYTREELQQAIDAAKTRPYSRGRAARVAA